MFFLFIFEFQKFLKISQELTKKKKEGIKKKKGDAAVLLKSITIKHGIPTIYNSDSLFIPCQQKKKKLERR